MAEDEIHYQNYSIKSGVEGDEGSQVDQASTSYCDSPISCVDDDERPVYANQSTLDNCRRKGKPTADSETVVAATKLSTNDKSFEAADEDDRNNERNDGSGYDDGGPGLLRCFLTTLGITVLVGSYVFLGAFIFTAVEGPNESSQLHKFARARNDTVVELATELRQVHPHADIWKRKIVQYFDIYEKQVVWACNHGYTGQMTDGQKKWTFKRSLYFVVSVLTTVGTGIEDMVPQTHWGISILFIYTTIGIPLSIIWFVTVGASLAHLIVAVYNQLCCYMCHRCCKNRTDIYRPHDAENKTRRHTEQRLFVPSLISLMLFACWMLFGIIVLRIWEDMDYLESAMFVFSIFSTIGFSRRRLRFLDNDERNNVNTEKLASFLSFVIFGFVLLTVCVRLFYLLAIRCSGCSHSKRKKIIAK